MHPNAHGNDSIEGHQACFVLAFCISNGHNSQLDTTLQGNAKR